MKKCICSHYSKFLWLVFLFLNLSIDSFSQENKWVLSIHQQNGITLLVDSFTVPAQKELIFTKTVKDYNVSFILQPKADFYTFSASLTSQKEVLPAYLSLSKHYRNGELPYNFDGLVRHSNVYRQSPHEPNDYHFKGLSKQPIPMFAIYDKRGFDVAICNSPVFYDNYTTQTFDLQKKEIGISSGDNGYVFQDNIFKLKIDTSSVKQKGQCKIEPHYFEIKDKDSHVFEGVLVRLNNLDSNKLRRAVNLIVSKNWSKGTVSDLFGSSFFSTAYMNLRVNETKKSKYWVVPAIEYANKQYSRDAFWISMVLPENFAAQCYENEAYNDKTFGGAERPLFTIIWAYKTLQKGGQIDTARVRRILEVTEKHVVDGYYSGYIKGTVGGGWQGWADNLSFEKEDAISNNQGLFVVALMCAEKMGIKSKTPVSLALANYQQLFNAKTNAFPLSKQKDTVLAVDALMGDLLAQVILGKTLVSDQFALAHFETMKAKAKTVNGFKVFCNADGSYLNLEQYRCKSFESAIEKVIDGEYQMGGSWYLYDMLMLMDAHIHGAKDAEDLMIWRTKIEFAKGNTTHEFINTVTGKPFKPNMGWNAGVFGVWSALMKQGKATNKFFKAIDNYLEK